MSVSRSTARRQYSARARAGTLQQAVAPKVVRVAGYFRASTDEANQPYTLGMQEEKVRAYCQSQDDMELTAVYEERASGKDIEGRPQLLQLLEDAAAGKFDAVVVYKVDRWSRRLADLIASVDFLDRHSVRFASVTEPIDTSTPMGRMVLQMLGSFAEFERGLIVERVIGGIEAKVAKGLPLSSQVGFGLRVDSNGVVEADPETFGVVQRIFEEYTRDLRGTKAIAQRLQAAGLPTPGSVPWSAPAVARVLRSRTLIGQLPFRDSWVDGAHAPLLDLDLFEKAQVLADSRSSQRAAAHAKGDFVLTGVIRCGRCDAPYTGTTGTSANGAKVRYYACLTGRRYGKRSCDGPTVPADALETLVADALLDVYANHELFAEAIADHLARQEDRAAPITAELTAARAAEASAARKLARYRDDYEAERITGVTYEEAKARLEPELSAARDHIARLELDLAARDLVAVPTDADRKALHALMTERVRTGSVAARKALFAALVEKLVVYDIDSVTPTFALTSPDRLSESVRAGSEDPALAPAGEMFACHTPGWS